MIKAVVFDLDHTLFDRYETLKLVVKQFDKVFKIKEGVTKEYIAKEIIWADKHYVHRGWEEIHAHLCEKGVFEEIPTFEEYTKKVLSCFKGIAVKYPFAIPTLQKIREMGYKTGLITNGNHDVQQSKLKMLELGGLFDEVIISGDYDFQKPDKRIFHLMAEKLCVEPNEMMYVGDHPKFDVDGSRNAGCVPVWVRTTGTWIFPEIEKCELQVETVEEIPALIDRLR